MPSMKKMKPDVGVEKEIELPQPGYLDDCQLSQAILALTKYAKKNRLVKRKAKKDLLEAGQNGQSSKIFVEVVFKNIPSNSKTYIHNVVLPNHWRWTLEPEEYDIAVFVRHRRADNEAQKIQFSKDRDLDIDNTHTYYQKLFEEKLEEPIRSRISRIITTKEFATEFNTFQKLDRLSKTYDLFLSDKQLMANKMNSLPRRLGRRFWVRERKVPLMVRIDANNLNDRFKKALSTEPFYILGSSSTEKMQIGVIGQSKDDLVENLSSFLMRLYELYEDDVRIISLRTEFGSRIPIYADLSASCPTVTMRKLKNKPKPVIDDFDMLEGEAKISVHPGGKVRVIRKKRRSSLTPEKPTKKAKKMN